MPLRRCALGFTFVCWRLREAEVCEARVREAEVREAEVREAERRANYDGNHRTDEYLVVF